LKRRANSPLVAEIFLIFITVIVAIPLGGFLYSTMGNYTKTANVAVSFVNCNPGSQTNTTACALNLDNTGSANAELRPSSYLLIFYGESTSSTYSQDCFGQGGDEIPAGSSLVVNCVFNVTPGQDGARFTGWVALVSGQNLPFAGVF
jgi:hypothetical protein